MVGGNDDKGADRLRGITDMCIILAVVMFHRCIPISNCNKMHMQFIVCQVYFNKVGKNCSFIILKGGKFWKRDFAVENSILERKTKHSPSYYVFFRFFLPSQILYFGLIGDFTTCKSSLNSLEVLLNL